VANIAERRIVVARPQMEQSFRRRCGSLDA